MVYLVADPGGREFNPPRGVSACHFENFYGRALSRTLDPHPTPYRRIPAPEEFLDPPRCAYSEIISVTCIEQVFRAYLTTIFSCV